MLKDCIKRKLAELEYRDTGQQVAQCGLPAADDMPVNETNFRAGFEFTAEEFFTHTRNVTFAPLQLFDELFSLKQDMVGPDCAAPLVGPDHADFPARSVADRLDDSVIFYVRHVIPFLLYCSIGCLPMIWRNGKK